MPRNTARRFLLILSAWLLFGGLVCLSQAQVSQTGGGKGNPGVAGGTVIIDQIGTDLKSSTSSTGFTSTAGQVITITGGLTDSALVVSVIQCDGALAITGVTVNWDTDGTPQAMTSINSATSLTIKGYFFGLRSPTSGAKKFDVAWTNAAQVVINAVSYSGVNQTSDANAFKNFNSAINAAPITVSVSSAVGHRVIGAFGSLANFVSVNNTQVTLDNGCNTWAVAGNEAAGAASVNLTGNPGSAVTSLAIGMDISP